MHIVKSATRKSFHPTHRSLVSAYCTPGTVQSGCRGQKTSRMRSAGPRDGLGRRKRSYRPVGCFFPSLSSEETGFQQRQTQHSSLGQMFIAWQPPLSGPRVEEGAKSIIETKIDDSNPSTEAPALDTEKTSSGPHPQPVNSYVGHHPRSSVSRLLEGGDVAAAQ